VIPRASSTPLGKINLMAVCAVGENKHREILKFEVADFDIDNNCILGRPFLIKFMAVIHSTYAYMKMSRSKGIISIPLDPKDVLTYDVSSLEIAARFEGEVVVVATTKDDKTGLESHHFSPTTDTS
jgi:hypothetical protein